jgi:hypothetical protein
MNLQVPNSKPRVSVFSGIVHIVLTIFALAGLVAPLVIDRPFYLDWINHVWSINYFSAYFGKHGDFPLFFNGFGAAGNPAPVFYGFLFYPILGLLACMLTADLAVRVAAAGLLIVHFILYFRIARTSLSFPAAIGLGAICVSSVYQMTNLYNRSALTEFFSYELFSIAIPLFFLSIWSGSTIRTGLFASSVGMLVTAVGMHPPTAYSTAIFVGPIIALLGFALMKANRPCIRLVHIIFVAVACCVIAPWLYFVVKYAALLGISNDPSQVPGVDYFPTTIDSLMGKLSPFYVDRRTLVDGIAQTSTPFLNASLQIPMLVAVLSLGALTWRSAGRLYRVVVSLMFVFCAVTIFLSLPPTRALLVKTDHRYVWIMPKGLFFLYDIIDPLQFAYRLTNTLSLQLSTLLLFVIFNLKRSPHNKVSGMSIVVTILLSIAVVGIYLQDRAIFSEFSFNSSGLNSDQQGAQAKLNNKVLGYDWSSYNRQIRDIEHYPDTFYSQDAYAMQGLVKVKNFAGDPTPWVLATFVETQATPSITVNCASPCLVQTNLLSSVFVRPMLNRVPVPKDGVVSISGRLAFMAPAGTSQVSFEQVGRALIFFRGARWIGVLWLIGAALYLGAMPVCRMTRRLLKGRAAA